MIEIVWTDCEILIGLSTFLAETDVIDEIWRTTLLCSWAFKIFSHKQNILRKYTFYMFVSRQVPKFRVTHKRIKQSLDVVKKKSQFFFYFRSFNKFIDPRDKVKIACYQTCVNSSWSTHCRTRKKRNWLALAW